MLNAAMKARSQPSFAKAIRALRAGAKARAKPVPPVPVRVLIAYVDIPSARNAIARVERLMHTSPTERPTELHPLLWRFDQLDDPRWRETALRDAANATALVLAMSDEADFCPRTEAWMTALLNRMRGSNVTVLALIGERDAWTITLAQPASTLARQHAGDTTAPTAPVEVFASATPKRMAACAA